MATRPPKDADVTGSAEDFLPRSTDLSSLERASKGCRGCELFKEGTQAVFGEGSPHAKFMLVGEQPGDKEDLSGRPFVGPAGQLLHHALEEAGIRVEDTYITNAVKHFHWKPVGKRRLHQKPGVRHINACRPWLDAELAAVMPVVVICLGATAAQAVFGKPMKIGEWRGQILPSDACDRTVITVHPSALLRAPDEASRAAGYRQFVTDLARAKIAARGRPARRDHHESPRL